MKKDMGFNLTVLPLLELDKSTSTRTILPHGHSEKTIALRADLLNHIFIYRMGSNICVLKKR